LLAVQNSVQGVDRLAQLATAEMIQLTKFSTTPVSKRLKECFNFPGNVAFIR